MESIKSKYDILICGGGIAGLVVALSLSKYELDILIVEKGEKINANGADVLKPSGIKILSELGVLEDLVKKEARKRTEVDIFYNGELLANMDYTKENDLSYFYLVPYQVVITTIMEHLSRKKNVTLKMKTSLTGIRSHKGDFIDEIFLNESIKINADVIIGADGVNSTLRNLLGIPATPIFYDQAMYFNHFPLAKSVEEKNRLYIDSDFGIAYFYPISYSRFRSVIGLPRDEGKVIFKDNDPKRLIERLRKFVTCSDDALENIKTSDGFATFPLCKMNLEKYHKGNAVLIGNASHSIHPISGQGMNLAIEDAGELSQGLIKYFKGTERLKETLEEYTEVRHFINKKIVDYGDALATNFGDKEAFARSLNLKLQTSGRQIECF